MVLAIILKRYGDNMRFELNRQIIDELISLISDDFLVKKLRRSIGLGEIKVKDAYPNKKYELELSEDEIEIVLNDLSDAISNLGVGSDGNINSYGYRIEELIDIFNDC